MFPYFYINTLFSAALLLTAYKMRRNSIRKGKYFYYTALGDSISFGLSASFNRGYVFLLKNYFKRKCPCVWLENQGVPGITSCGQLILLRNSSPIRQTVKKTDVITISIGGNNLLKATNQGYTCIDEKIAFEGVNKFAQDWPRILECIRNDICSGAQIYVITLYNPYKCCDPNYLIANQYITQINSIIADPALIARYGYTVVDVYSCFEKDINKTWTNFNISKRNPHPNNEGHKKIAILHARAIEANRLSNKLRQQI